MSKLELINKYLKNAKITQNQLKKICHCFAYDFTASKTAEKTGLSRQTINSHYKMLREFLIDTYLMKNEKSNFNQKSFLLKYINLNAQTIYYLQDNETQIILDENDTELQDIINFVKITIKDKLKNHSKANTARILYHEPQKEYFVSTYLNSEDTLEMFIYNRLKKFRGLTKNNIKLHIKESIIRFNTNETFLYNSLSTIFR